MVFALTHPGCSLSTRFGGQWAVLGVHSRRSIEAVTGLLCVMDERAVLPTLGAKEASVSLEGKSGSR